MSMHLSCCYTDSCRWCTGKLSRSNGLMPVDDRSMGSDTKPSLKAVQKLPQLCAANGQRLHGPLDKGRELIPSFSGLLPTLPRQALSRLAAPRAPSHIPNPQTAAQHETDEQSRGDFISCSTHFYHTIRSQSAQPYAHAVCTRLFLPNLGQQLVIAEERVLFIANLDRRAAILHN